MNQEMIKSFVLISMLSIIGDFCYNWLKNKSDSRDDNTKREKTKEHGTFKRPDLKKYKLTTHEMMFEEQLTIPDEMTVTWDNIAGLDSIIQELQENFILPIQQRHLFADSRLTRPPTGILLHGPPGVGKTLIAKAIAKEAKTQFINLDISTITNKFYGESQKSTAALFSLAAKLQPCIIFIDEIDSFLRSRTGSDHEVTAMVKAQFMSLWDGLATDPDSVVIVMGATNRPGDLDEAILRRLTMKIRINLPNVLQRESIVKLILTNESTASDVNIQLIAEQTERFSGADLMEMCRKASMYRVKNYASKISRDSLQSGGATTSSDVIRSITMEDFNVSIKKFKESLNFN